MLFGNCLDTLCMSKFWRKYMIMFADFMVTVESFVGHFKLFLARCRYF